MEKTNEPGIIKGIYTEEFGLIQERDGTFTVKEYDTLKVDFNKEKEFFSKQYYKYSLAPTTILSKAIEQVEQMGDYKVMVALVDLRKDGKPLKKDERVYTFTDIKSKKLRGVIYEELEKNFE